jgi:hypothetical protein
VFIVFTDLRTIAVPPQTRHCSIPRAPVHFRSPPSCTNRRRRNERRGFGPHRPCSNRTKCPLPSDARLSRRRDGRIRTPNATTCPQNTRDRSVDTGHLVAANAVPSRGGERSVAAINAMAVANHSHQSRSGARTDVVSRAQPTPVCRFRLFAFRPALLTLGSASSAARVANRRPQSLTLV